MESTISFSFSYILNNKSKINMTAKELKEALANVPDDAEVLISVYNEDLGCDVPCPIHKVVKNCDKNIVIV